MLCWRVELSMGHDPIASCLPCMCASFAPREQIIEVVEVVRRTESCEMREPYRENH